ncbi:MAG: c-type cytochrome [Methylophilaceae bacterium]|jgi:mono/diheme cytochrome c family protein
MRTALLLMLLFSSLALAQPFSEGNAQIGKAMVEKHCIECHARRFGGDGSKIYTRENRIVNSSKGLIAQIRNCNTMLGMKWFEDEELNVAAFLNQSYYHFDK